MQLEPIQRVLPPHNERVPANEKDFAQMLYDLNQCNAKKDWNPEKIRLGIETIASLFSQKETCKNCLHYVDANFPKPREDSIIWLLEKIKDWQKAFPDATFEKMAEDWKSHHFNLASLYFICFIGQGFFLHAEIYDVLRSQSLSPEATHLLYLLEETGDISINFFLPFSEVRDLQLYFELHANSLRTLAETQELLDISFLPAFLHVLLLLQIFKEKSRLKLKHMPIPNIEVLALWADQLKDYPLPKTHLVNDVLDSFKGRNWSETSQKITALVAKSNDLTQVLEEEKLTKNEMERIVNLGNLFRQLKRYEKTIANPNADFWNKVIPQCLPTESDPINVVSFNEAARESDNYERSSSIVDKIINFITKVLVSLLTPYGHTFFIHYSPDEPTLLAHGKKCKEKTYHHSFNLPSRYAENHRIDTSVLTPDNFTPEQKQQFRTNFNKRLEQLISVQRTHPPLGLEAYKVFIPSFTTTRPEEVKLTDGQQRTMSCVQYVAEAIIEAHVDTCREFQTPIPETLEFYGFKKTQNLSRLRPVEFLTAMKTRGILKKQFKPYHCRAQLQPA